MATTTYKVLGQVNPTANTTSTLYQAPAYVSTVISSITVCNQNNTATTFSIAIRPANASLLSRHYLNFNTALQPYDTIPITIGITLASTDVVDVSSTSSNVSFTAFGSEINSSPSNNIPTINSVVITDENYNTTSTTAVNNNNGGYIKLLGSGFDYNPSVYIGTTSTSAVYVSNVEVRARVPNNPVGTYNVMLFNGTGIGTVYQSGLLYSADPTLNNTTYAGEYYLSVQLAGAGDAPLTYSLVSGSLPAGSSLSSTGLITGTGINGGTYGFTIRITDAQGQFTTIPVQLVILTMPTSMEMLFVGGGGAGGYQYGGGGGAGGVVYVSSQPVSSGVLYAITVGAGGASPLTATVGSSGQNTSLSTPAIVNPLAYSVAFNGSNQYLSLTNNAGFSLSTGDFTFEAWIYLDTAATGVTSYRIFTNWAGGAESYQFYLRTNNRLIWQINSQNSPDVAALAITPFTWTHVAFCRSGTTVTTFINGRLADTTTGVTNSANGVGTPRVGADAAGGNYWLGYISNLRLVKGNALYTSNFTPPTSPLTAVSGTSLLTCQSNTFIDNSGNSIQITPLNNPGISSSVTPPFGIAVAFGGGGGGTDTDKSGRPGASGGGNSINGGSGGAGILGQGNAGGGASSTTISNGGGGASGAGGIGVGGTGTFTTILSTTTAIALGIGQYVTATNVVYFAGGGGGRASTAPLGGLGGGGLGATTSISGTSGTAYTGGGGGGGATGSSGAGGSGVAILRYPTTFKILPVVSGSYTLTTSSGYNNYVFTGSSYIYLSEQPVSVFLLDYLLVAGGGAAGNGGGAAFESGGGGAGGVVAGNYYIVPAGTTYYITVGTGGSAGTQNSGTNSTAFGQTAIGGGRGATNPNAGGNGGSGGGGTHTSTAGGFGTFGQGNSGGAGATSRGGGGGGAGGTGAAGATGTGGIGTTTNIISTTTAIALGIGQYVTATNVVYFAGGGGGGGATTSGGSGGGGSGTNGSPGGNAINYTGGGGGGGGLMLSSIGGAGGDGVVILRYPDTYNAAIAVSGTQTTVISAGGYRIYAFKASGSITF